ncbi:MAG: dihydrofolate reductase [Eubacteriales bacterium]|nr:dihydrofolate reductase [Eubacteriales bacterium]
MRAIACVDMAWGIGLKGQMLFDLPGDLAYFARMTRGKTLVMGRKTLESLPGGRPLKDRTNIILTRDPGFSVPGVLVARSVEELEGLTASIPPDDVMVIGGQDIYTLLIDRCDAAYITRVYATSPADRFFPNLDKRPGWQIARCGREQEENGLRYAFCEYERIE